MTKRKKKGAEEGESLDISTNEATGLTLGKLNNEVDDEVRQIEDAVRAGLNRLTLKQRKFTEAWATGNYSRKDAALKAGYTVGSAHVMAYKLLNNHPVISQITPLMQRLNQLTHGIPVQYKRKELLKMFKVTSQPGENFNPAAANTTMRLLAEMDGDVKNAQQGGSNIVLKINTGISREPVSSVIEGEVVETVEPDSDLVEV